MKVLVAHNYYQQRGGEDRVFELETSLLEAHGHEVVRHTIHNEATREISPIGLGLRTIWSRDSYSALADIVRREKPSIVHFHNTFPLISPAAYYAVRRSGSAVVQTLHNYRLMCPGSTLFRDGRICEDCSAKTVKWPAVLHGCYRDNRLATIAAAAMISTHHWIGTWDQQVDSFIAIGSFVAEKMIQGGLPSSKVAVKTNCVHPDPGLGERRGDYALFLGRLVPEKGIEVLLKAWNLVEQPIPLRIVGDGPLAPLVEENLRTGRVEWLGEQPTSTVNALLRDARLLVVPSIWYEGVPLTILEGFAAGAPVLASRLGSMERFIADQKTGVLFTPNDARDLAAKVNWLLAEPDRAESIRLQARAEYESRYTGEKNYERLMEIYSSALRIRHAEGGCQVAHAGIGDSANG